MRWLNRIWRSLFPNALRPIGDPQTCRHTHDSDALVMAYTTKSQLVGFSLIAEIGASWREF
jgi:hypothetical protein